ncbi:hypothetical protein DX884_20705, partial [Vibrio fluvialis]|nr:hypothetical protein [Vibrio fluvialis]
QIAFEDQCFLQCFKLDGEIGFFVRFHIAHRSIDKKYDDECKQKALDLQIKGRRCGNWGLIEDHAPETLPYVSAILWSNLTKIQSLR